MMRTLVSGSCSARRAVFMLCAALAAAGSAQTTTSSLTIGGLGAATCGPATDPPTLAGGIAVGGTLDFSYDPITHHLTLVVSNTSPNTPGAPNPLIRRLCFNVPQLAVTGATLISQTSAGGVAPNFEMAVDVSQTPPNPLSGGCLGKFGILLEGPNNGGVSNAAASTFSSPAVSVGPVTFVIAITTISTDLTAWSFAQSLPVDSGSSLPSNAACRFVDGGPAGAAAWIGTKQEGSAAGWVIGEPLSGQTITVVQSGLPGWYACTAVSLDAGPTQAIGLTFPIGLPAVVLMAEFIPASGFTTITFVVPQLPPALFLEAVAISAEIKFYGAVLVVSPDNRTFNVSDQFTLTIRDEDVGSG